MAFNKDQDRMIAERARMGLVRWDVEKKGPYDKGINEEKRKKRALEKQARKK